MGHISQAHDGHWLFKALLAPKPHQEHTKDGHNGIVDREGTPSRVLSASAHLPIIESLCIHAA